MVSQSVKYGSAVFVQSSDIIKEHSQLVFCFHILVIVLEILFWMPESKLKHFALVNKKMITLLH